MSVMLGCDESTGRRCYYNTVIKNKSVFLVDRFLAECHIKCILYRQMQESLPSQMIK